MFAQDGCLKAESTTSLARTREGYENQRWSLDSTTSRHSLGDHRRGESDVACYFHSPECAAVRLKSVDKRQIRRYLPTETTKTLLANRLCSNTNSVFIF